MVWDSIIPLDKLWEQYDRIIKDRGTIVLTATQPFTTMLINSKPDYFKYCWYWIKNKPVGFAYSKIQPLRNVEDVVIFQKPNYFENSTLELREYFNNMRIGYIGKTIKEINKIMGSRHAEHCFYYKSKQFNIPDEPTYNKLISIFGIDKWDEFLTYKEVLKMGGYVYNPQELVKKEVPKKMNKKANEDRPWVYNQGSLTGKDYIVEYENYPKQTLMINSESKPIHPTQKPVALIEYLIKTYSNEDEVILDNTMGSGTTCVASLNTNRKFIGIEQEEKYFNISKERIEEKINNSKRGLF